MKKFIVQVTECVDYHYDVEVEAPDAYQAATKAEALVEQGVFLPLGNEVKCRSTTRTGVFATNIKEPGNGKTKDEVEEENKEK